VPSFRLAHLSDPHLPPPPGALEWRDLASKRLLSRLAWQRKGHQHQRAILDALTADVRAYGPDHIALTGDLTNFSTRLEVAAARDWLETLGPPSDVTVSPGNHDALVGRADGTFGAWAPWLGDGDDAPFPRVRERGGIALINLCSAVPTALHLATGRLGEAQLQRLDAVLAGLAGRGLFRLVMIHHPPVPGVVSRRKSLVDGDALAAVVRRHGVDLVIHGHAHEAAVSTLQGPEGPIPVLGVPSASAAPDGRHPAARWHAFEITPSPAGPTVRVTARGLDARLGRFEPLGTYVAVPTQCG
jgi:3',5'-cyclic AMP phosphodiesterase CpdA